MHPATEGLWDAEVLLMGLLPNLFREKGGRGSGKSRAVPLLPAPPPPAVDGTGSLFILTWKVCCGQQEHCAIRGTVPTNLHARSEASLQSLCLAHTHRAKVIPCEDLQNQSPSHTSGAKFSNRVKVQPRPTGLLRVVASVEGVWVVETFYRGADIPSAAHSRCV